MTGRTPGLQPRQHWLGGRRLDRPGQPQHRGLDHRRQHRPELGERGPGNPLLATAAQVKAAVVLGAHNGHVQRSPAALPGMAPAATKGMDLADRLGHGYLVIGTTSRRGQTLNTDPCFYSGELFAELGPSETGSLDALMAASYDGPFATDLRRLSPPDAAAVRASHQLRYGTYYADLNPLESFDVVIHLPQVTSAGPDPDALAQSPEDVRKAFAWNADR